MKRIATIMCLSSVAAMALMSISDGSADEGVEESTGAGSPTPTPEVDVAESEPLATDEEVEAGLDGDLAESDDDDDEGDEPAAA